MKKYYVYLSMIIIVGILGVLNFNLKTVKVVTAQFLTQKEYVQQIIVNGEFQSKDKTDITLPYPVYIKDVLVKQNSYVNNGQPLFTVDKEKMLEFLTGQEQIDLSGYMIDVQLLDYMSYRNNIDISDIPDTVYSECSGIVTALNISAGSVSMPETTLLTVGSSDQVVAKFSLSQIDYGKVSVGDKVKITPVAFSSTHYNGVITNDNAIIKKTSSINGSQITVDVFAYITDADAKVADGLQINGVIDTSTPRMINVIDYDYVHQDENGQYVMIFDKGTARKTYIDTGLETTQYTEILNDFNEDTVFLKGDIKEGDRVILHID